MSAANTSSEALHQHVEELAQLEVLKRGLGDLLELPDRRGHRLGLGARRPPASARRCSVKATSCQM